MNGYLPCECDRNLYPNAVFTKIVIFNSYWQNLSEPEFSGDLGNKFSMTVGKTDFFVQLKKNKNISIATQDRLHYGCFAANCTHAGKLHTYLVTQLWLITLLPSLIARLWVGPQTERKAPSSICFRWSVPVYQWAQRGIVCGFLVLSLQIAIEHRFVS